MGTNNASSNETETSGIMPESEGNVLCIRHSGVISMAQANIIRKYLEDIAEKYDSLRGLVFYDEDYKGYTVEAAEISLHFMMDLGEKAEKIAYVNAPETRKKLNETVPELAGAEIRYFAKEELQDAISWVKSD